MSGKILFVDDECLNRFGEPHPHIITNTVHKLIKDGCLADEQCEIAKSFEDAVNKVINVKNGNDYSWIFIDRNLGTFTDINAEKPITVKVDKNTIEFNNKFFKNFENFEGDYLYFLLRKNGVPIEKICFLTANDPNNNGENSRLRTSHLVFDKDIPNTIIKLEKTSTKSSMEGNDDDEYIANDDDEKKLYETIANSLSVQISFKYREIFNNEKVKDIFGPYINDFIKMLAERYKNGQVAFERKNGIVLRNMIEAVVAYIGEKYFKDSDLRCRDLLNNKAKYNIKFDKKLNPKLVKHYFNYVEQNGIPTDTDQSKVENFLSNIDYYQTNKNKICDDAKNIISISQSLAISCILNKLQKLYEANISKLPPKYIFSYIDNIYTVTSEISAHGKNDKTTEDLGADGWSALLSGMIQIMQWVAGDKSK